MRPNEPKGERKNMKMTFRWYGSQSDKITLKQIKQIPGCTGLMGVLDYKAAGEVWEEDEIKAYIMGFGPTQSGLTIRAGRDPLVLVQLLLLTLPLVFK